MIISHKSLHISGVLCVFSHTIYEEYRRCIFVEEFTDIGYTELLANVIFDNVCTDEESDVLKFARALKEEDVSKEMSIYLICNKFV